MLPILPVNIGLSPIGPIAASPTDFGAGAPGVTSSVGGATQSFSDLLGQAIDAINTTQTQANNDATQIVTGQSSDLSTVMIDMEKAKTTFDLAVQVRDKSLDAYNELMQTQF